MDIKEFRQKYPEYQDVPDMELAQKFHAKYYSDMPFGNFAEKFGVKVQTTSTDEVPDWGRKNPNLYGAYGATVGTLQKLGEYAGLDKPAETIGKTAAYLTRPESVTPEMAKEAGLKPTTGELVGAGLQIGATALPYGSIAKGGEKVLQAIKAPAILAKAGGMATAGATGGYAYEAGEKIREGEAPVPGATTAISAVLPPALSGAAKGMKIAGEFLSVKAPVRLVNSLVKPLKKDFSYGKNPGRVIAEEGITANSFDDLVEKISAKRTEIGSKLGNLSTVLDDTAIAKNIKINAVDISSPIDDAINVAVKENNQGLVNRLNTVKNAITKNLDLVTDEAGNQVITVVGEKNLSNLTFKEALNMKREIGDMTKWTGNPSDDQAINGALKKVYDGIRNKVNTTAIKAEPSLAKSYIKLNEKYADITSADIATRYRENIVNRQDILHLKGHMAAVGGGLIALGTGGPIHAVLTGASIEVLNKVLASPAVKTRVASWLAKTSPAERNIIYRKIPKLAEAIDKAFGERTRFPGDIAADKIMGRGK